ncbi:hypothetical protein MBRA1_001843 [Malassezia brasiliensis]|uniref:Tetratricopeptide repeat protein n=1 Tax=Malassezia brasiliensis TaxID=1821822 RepID=A0AAF0DT31_9BASI|nr:hypothetical protein MBRA1_001843 [Malassezia brasiliensis]
MPGSDQCTSHAPGLAPDAPEKIAQGVAYKKQGNEAFVARDFAGALRAYHHAVLYLAGLDQSPTAGILPEQASASDPGAQGIREDKRELSQVRSNMAACYLQLARYDRAVESCDQAIALDSQNAKAIYRKAQALARRGDLHAAQDWLASEPAKPYAQDPAFLAEARTIAAQIEARERKSAQALRGFLSKGR